MSNCPNLESLDTRQYHKRLDEAQTHLRVADIHTDTALKALIKFNSTNLEATCAMSDLKEKGILFKMTKSTSLARRIMRYTEFKNQKDGLEKVWLELTVVESTLTQVLKLAMSYSAPQLNSFLENIRQALRALNHSLQVLEVSIAHQAT